MSYNLSREKQVTIIRALVEGVSIRSVERMTEVHRDTIMRLMVRIGEGCERLQDTMMRDLDCVAIEVDEIWGYVAKKQRNVTDKDDRTVTGDAWTFVAIDADTKLIPSFRTGKRNGETARAFIDDLSKRLRNRVQISSDGLALYPESVEQAFGCAVDYAQIVKTYSEEPGAAGRYSPAKVTSSEKFPIMGNPDEDRISTSYVERSNLSTRMTNRRMTRLTNAFSKKIENHKAMMALTFANYNLCRVHRTLRVTPAMAANVTDHVWTVAELVDAAVAA
jgi:IS1 family transposase